MHPIKNHRIVRHCVAMGAIGCGRRGTAALESAENEGWPPQRPTVARRAGKDTMPLVCFTACGDGAGK
jgi:hypothetical protein